MDSIKAVSTRFNITYDALRYYEKCGLLTDVQRDTNGRRIYDDAQIKNINRILHLRKLGASIAEVKEIAQIFDAQPSTAKYDQGLTLLAKLDQRLDDQFAELEDQKQFLHQKRLEFEREKQALK